MCEGGEGVMDEGNFIWLVGVKNGNRKLLAISEQSVRVGDAVRVEFQSAVEEPLLGEVIAAIQTERNSELHKWLIAASERNVTRRRIVKVWTLSANDG